MSEVYEPFELAARYGVNAISKNVKKLSTLGTHLLLLPISWIGWQRITTVHWQVPVIRMFSGVI